MKLLNVRVDDDLRDLIDRAVAVSDSPDRSAWAREALQAGALRELAAHAALQRRTRSGAGSPTPHSHPAEIRGVSAGSHGQVLTGDCVHPLPARWIGVTTETCTLCGATVRTRL